MTNANKLLMKLKQFSGSELYYRNPLFPKFTYTEGVQYLAKEAQAYWLIDYVFSNQHDATVREEVFQVWKIKVEPNHTSTITVEDGNYRVVKTYKLEFTDFPLEEFTLWFTNKTLLLPREY